MKMKNLFLDTANIEKIRNMTKSTFISGVTTNPSLMSKEGKGNYESNILDIAETLSENSRLMSNPEHRKGYPIPRFHLSVESYETDPGLLFSHSMLIWDLFAAGFNNVDLFLKVPVTLENMPVITKLSRNGVNVNATACMTPVQAKMATDAGANVVSFFYNRIKDEKEDPDLAVRQFKENESTFVICGSIRKPVDVIQAWENGSDAVTASPEIIADLLKHPQTDKAIRQFKEDIEKWRS